MRFNAILSLVVAALACKVSAECFAEKYGKPCCSNTKNVIFIDDKMKYGFENGVKCGIEPVTNAPLLNKRGNGKGKGKGNNGNGKAYGKYKNYMNLIHIDNICPADIIVKKEGVTYPEPQKVYYYSTTTGDERPMNVILPVGYTKSKKYPVLYYLHGIMCDEDTMLEEPLGAIATYQNLLEEHRTKEMIIVSPNQYAPAPGTAVPPSLDQPYYDGYDNFINDLVNDIMPYMEEHYSIATGRQNTAIVGFSMGGRNSLYIGYTRPDLFGYVGAVSPAPGVVEATDMISYHKGLLKPEELVAKHQPIVSMICAGTADSVVGNFPKEYHEILENNHQEHIWYEIPDADHDPTAITTGFYNFLTTLFGVLY